MRTLIPFAAILLLAGSVFAVKPVPRKADEFTIKEASGKETLLSSYKGKVCVVEFLHTTCPHCQATAQMFTKLQNEMGPRGFQAIGIAFNDNAALLVNNFVQQYHLVQPVGSASPETVMSYLGLSVMERWMVPQIVVIDKKGMIRAQSAAQGSPELQDEAHLRELIDKLLKEGSSATSTKKAPGKTGG